MNPFSCQMKVCKCNDCFLYAGIKQTKILKEPFCSAFFAPGCFCVIGADQIFYGNIVEIRDQQQSFKGWDSFIIFVI